jgi:hypothetical protein
MRTIARRSAPSVPEYAGSQRFALADVFESRGSIVISVAPSDCASMIRCACGLK